MKRLFKSTQTDYTAAISISKTTPWLAELFQNRSLKIITATAKLPAL
ncbi:hypothetical protein FOC1_g10000128 [Fusarium oxysporum f. sp. cubense race 1]|uniref:Uncharacterized protein n=1 Tax=Fusarium oxysporum f. sp. cubense (strain race 1) TaxID=1229664 RepID=N4UFS1_FUSC1|nr:hypothetical protein FOC1_g10000128 [Fusarium oxysporum f. sp. cubense race 1]